MSRILDLVDAADPAVIAVVGCGKNTGKTTTLNALIQGCTDRGERVGILSIGIDGEEADFWLGVPKPRVLAPAGTLLATAEEALRAGTARSRVLEGTGGRTLLGELVIGEVVEAGTVLLAGVRSRRDLAGAASRMRRLGARRVFLDGAWQRTMAADPRVADAVILATGAVLGRTCEEVAARTREVLDRLMLPMTDREDLRRAARRETGDPEESDESLEATLEPVTDRNPRKAAAPGTIEGPDLAPGVAVTGALTVDRMAALAQRVGTPGEVVARDPTRVFLGPADLDRWRRRGIVVRVADRAPVLGVTVNPYSVLGWTLPAADLREAVARVAAPIPALVLDPPT